MNNIAIISTGNAEEDARQLKQAQLHDARMDAGICPNGCAELIWETAYDAECPDCHFRLSTNLAYGKKELEQVM